MNLEQLKQEELEWEKRIFGGGEENPSEIKIEAPSPDEVEDVEDEVEDTEDIQEDTEVEVSQDQDDESEVPKKQQRTSWKKRYTTFKAKTDSTIYGLRQDLASTKAKLADAYDEIDNLKSSISEFKTQVKNSKDPYDGLISEEDREILGDEAINVLKKLLSKKDDDPRIESLQKELDKYKKERNDSLRKEGENFKAQSQAELKSRLYKLVPDLDVVDVDPRFHEYLQGIDEDSGVPRKTLFASAVTSRDVKNTARFYLDFVSLRPKTKEEILSSKVKPVGGASAPSGESKDNKKKFYHFKDYSAYMDDVSRGKYRGKDEERKRMDAIYDKAIMEGRMIY